MNNNIDTLIDNRELKKYVELIPGFIHNINTPLMNISGRIELIQYRQPNLRGANEILFQIEKLSDIVNSLRYIVELESTTVPININLAVFFESFLQFMKFNLKFKHNVKTMIDVDSKHYVTTIPKSLLNIVYEILTHSVKNLANTTVINIKTYVDGEKMFFDIRRQGSPFDEKLLVSINNNKVDLDDGETSSLSVAKYILNGLNGNIRINNIDNEQQYLFNIPCK